jgi:hypothetical protein
VEQKEAKILLALVFNKIETCKKIYFEARATGGATVKEKESA